MLNPLAVAALVTSLLCLAPLGLVLGIVALVQISRKGQRGQGLAIAGISVSGVVLVLAGIALTVVDFRVWAPPERGDTGEIAKPGWTSVHSIEVGDCFNPGAWMPDRDTPPLGGLNVELVPCDEPHRAEAYATFALSGQGGFPGRDGIAETAFARCTEFYLDYSMDPMAFGRLQTYYFHPDERGWDSGRRTVLCWVARPGSAELDFSVRRDASNLDSPQLTFLTAVKPLNTATALRPAKNPQQDLAGAKVWAGRMAEAQTETVDLLKDAELPTAEQPVGQLVTELEAGLPYWEQAAEAPDADAFLQALRSVDQHNGEQPLRGIRAALDLPTPSAGQSAVLEGRDE
ncbi:DUF4190 domain-containing protein [Streptomyces poriticola]|uniref:DUF4190 domain-containing protein n=1 Tax=Streptomyces poriticola TaxID=3120506 RepID=UPI002FCE11A5